MVRKIFLLRHGEASSAGLGSKDFERPLTSNGIAKIHDLGHHLRAKSFAPDIIYCSPAVRTRQTLQNLSQTVNKEWDTEFVDDIYEASVRVLFNVLSETDSSFESAMIIGHNPGLSYLAEYLTGEPIINMMPGDFLTLEFIMDGWESLSQGVCSLVGEY